MIIDCDRNADLQWAHAQPCVQRAARILADRPHQLILDYALELMIAADAGSLLANYQARMARLPAGQEKDDVLELFQQCHNIATWAQRGMPADQRRLLRGAFLEALIANLLPIPSRAAAIHPEARLRLDPDESPCFDVLAVQASSDPDFEAFEGKTYPPDLTDEYLLRVAHFATAARENHGYVVELTIATTASRDFVRSVFAGRTFPAEVRCATSETLMLLRMGRAPHTLQAVVDGTAA